MIENDVTRRMLRGLCAVPGCFARKRHGGQFSSGDPDIAAVHRGLAVFIEVKMLRDGVLTELQAAMLDRWRAAGAATLVACYDADRMLQCYHPVPEAAWSALAGRTHHLSQAPLSCSRLLCSVPVTPAGMYDLLRLVAAAAGVQRA